jgi:hypothetical protein
VELRRLPTGSYANNIRIATAAKQRGWKWNPYGSASRAGPLAGQREEHKVEILSRPTLFATMGTQLRKGQGPPLWHLSFRKPISVGVGSVSSCSRILLFFINAIFKASVL